jgi:phosphoglycerol transferase MdoB-like AlkP superfamily enzyme
MPAVEDSGAMNEHLTAMKYADWALGEFFDDIRDAPFYRDTLFVLLGDHGFGTNQQLPVNAIDLLPFHVPLLLIGEGLQHTWGAQRDTVASQVDVVPTIMGLLGTDYQHQCWGRDLFNLPEGDAGYALIKPSGNNPAVALLADDQVLVAPQASDNHLYRYQLYPSPQAQPDTSETDRQRFALAMKSLVKTATDALINNRLAPE